MKPIKGLWEQITTFENLYAAYRSAAKGKRFRKEVLAFSDNLEASLFDLQRDFLQGTYEVGGYREFYVYEPKKRLVMALPFRDRVAQWAIYQVVNPLFAKTYIEDSHIILRKPTALKMRRRLRKLQKDYAAGAVDRPEVKMTLASYNGMLKHCDSYRMTFKIFGGSTEDGSVSGWFILRREPPK